MRAAVVVGDILLEHPFGVRLIPHEDVVETDEVAQLPGAAALGRSGRGALFRSRGVGAQPGRGGELADADPEPALLGRGGAPLMRPNPALQVTMRKQSPPAPPRRADAATRLAWASAAVQAWHQR